MFQIKEAIEGIGIASKALNYPVVSGNVSLYNETNQKSILPTPVIGGVGLIKNFLKATSMQINKNDSIFLVGEYLGHMQLSEYNRACNNNEGSPPKLDLKRELKTGEFIKDFLQENDEIVSGCHDLSEGGLILALAELAIANRKGIKIKTPEHIKNPIKWYFCEDQARYLLVLNDDKKILEISKLNKINVEKVGEVRGNSFSIINMFEIPMKKLINYNNAWFKNYMEK